MLVCLLVTALAVVRERELGTLEQLMVSPIRPFELMVGKTLPFALVGCVDLVLITPWRCSGSAFRSSAASPLLVVGSVLFILSALGLGLLVSTVSHTQQEAFMATFLIFMPMMLLSGFMFPVSSMPPFFRWLTLANPLRHYLEIVRGIFLKGVGLTVLWRQFAALAAMGAGLFALAASAFASASVEAGRGRAPAAWAALPGRMVRAAALLAAEMPPVVRRGPPSRSFRTDPAGPAGRTSRPCDRRRQE